MRLAAIKPDRLAVVRDDSFVIVSDVLARNGGPPAAASMMDLIGRYDGLKDALAAAASKGPSMGIDAKQLRPPVDRPSKIWAAASNYRRGGSGIENAAGRGATSTASPESILEMAFLKPSSAVIGPEEQIIIPEGAETIFPELELCVVIGKEARNISKERAL